MPRKSVYRARRRFNSELGLNMATIASPGLSHAYHLIIYRFRPIFGAGAKKARNGG
jgi:hypothetical protein